MKKVKNTFCWSSPQSHHGATVTAHKWQNEKYKWQHLQTRTRGFGKTTVGMWINSTPRCPLGNLLTLLKTFYPPHHPPAVQFLAFFHPFTAVWESFSLLCHFAVTSRPVNIRPSRLRPENTRGRQQGSQRHSTTGICSWWWSGIITVLISVTSNLIVDVKLVDLTKPGTPHLPACV